MFKICANEWLMVNGGPHRYNDCFYIFNTIFVSSHFSIPTVLIMVGIYMYNVLVIGSYNRYVNVSV